MQMRGYDVFCSERQTEFLKKKLEIVCAFGRMCGSCILPVDMMHSRMLRPVCDQCELPCVARAACVWARRRGECLSNEILTIKQPATKAHKILF